MLYIPINIRKFKIVQNHVFKFSNFKQSKNKTRRYIQHEGKSCQSSVETYYFHVIFMLFSFYHLVLFAKFKGTY